MDGFDFTYILSLVQAIIPSLLCITLHELSHGFTAYLLGDNTAKSRGRLTLNPLKHLDVIGLLMMLTCHVGWAKPVPVNMYNFKNPKRGMAITALAGPVSNALISLVFLFAFGAAYLPLKECDVGVYFLRLFRTTAYFSLGLGLFNLIPIPPLDGAKVLFSIIGDEGYYKLMRYERYGGIVLFALMLSGVLSKPLSAIISAAYDALWPAAMLGFKLTQVLFY